MNWTVTHDANGYAIIDDRGNSRGFYANPTIMATHLALALKEIDNLRESKLHDDIFRRFTTEDTQP